MTIKKYTVEVTRVDEYEIEIDTDVWNEERIQEFNDNFFHSENEEDIVSHVAKGISCGGKAQFLEGFGFVKQRYQRMPEGIIDQYENHLKVPEDKYDSGIRVQIIEYDNEYVAELFQK